MKIFFVIFMLIIFAQLFSTGRSEGVVSLEIPDSTQVQILTVEDGSSFIGRIIEIAEEEIKFKTKYGVLTFSIFEITEVKLVPEDRFKEGKYWFPNPNATRLFFAPTARMLKKGEGYFADYFIIFPTFTFGITNNITIGGGFSIIPGLDIDKQILVFT
ncbi:MAG: hypothetical protein KAT74_12365, partial [Candidatus Cloacimonetes bacterium]|nr:hypothetical protein [Candidatus Cloacimonadota bacterium]